MDRTKFGLPADFVLSCVFSTVAGFPLSIYNYKRKLDGLYFKLGSAHANSTRFLPTNNIQGNLSQKSLVITHSAMTER